MSLPTRVIRSARWKSGLLCLMFLGVPLFLAASSADDPVGWIAVSLCMLGGLVGVIHVVWPARLTLSLDGLTYWGMGRQWSVPWRDIETLRLWRNPAPHANQTLVGWRLKPEARKRGVLASANRMLGVDGALPGLWSLSPDALLAVMAEYHTAAAGER